MGYLEERDLSDVPTIPEYYNNKTIFITGGTGFIGKLLIEKLLYSCTDLKRIYLLLRPKKGVSPVDRLDQLYTIPCFNRLRNEKPGIFESKVSVVCGDVLDHDLGLSDEDRELLIDQVNIIFHVAASVRFDDTLKYAINLNLYGTKKVMELAKEMKNISSIVHVSTSFSNSNRPIIEEIMYPPLGNWKEMIEIVDKVDDYTLSLLTSKVLGEIPNTYTFAKQLAEHAVYELKGTLPIVMCRPSVVISSAEEPIPGWIDNFNGPVAILVASGAGILRSFYADGSLTPDYIPVDFTVKCLIAAAWIRGTKKPEPTDDIEIYNCCANNIKSVTYGEMIDIGKKLVELYPLEKTVWYPGGSITSSKYYNYFRVYAFQVLPAILLDLILRISGRKPMLIKIQRRIFNASHALSYYAHNQWTFCNKNFISLQSSIKEEDKKQFYYDMEVVEPLSFFSNGCVWAKEYLLNEKMEDLPKAKAWFQKLKFLDRFVKIVFYGYCIWWIINSSIVKSFADVLYGFIFL